MFTRFACLLVTALEMLFPVVQTLTKEEIGDRWQSPEIYYFLDDPSPRLWQRLVAILRLDRNAVSFWRKRQQFLKLRGWGSVTINQHVS